MLPYVVTMTAFVTPENLRFASYNIRKTKGLDGNFDPGRIISVINALDADVLALQEVDHRLGDRPTALARELIERETDFQVPAFARNDVSLGWHGNLILVRKGLELGALHHLELPGLEPRGAIAVDLVLPQKVRVIGTHLGLTRYHRRQQLSTITNHLEPETKTILLGDFNEWAAKRGLEPLEDHFDVHSPGRSFHAARPIAALDRIALSQGLSLNDGGVMESEISKRASDHLPIWADIALK
ncbi:MAG: endonuclease/exonuclease/phosphatase family protein [Paracoccaceae bacterium]